MAFAALRATRIAQNAGKKSSFSSHKAYLSLTAVKRNAQRDPMTGEFSSLPEIEASRYSKSPLKTTTHPRKARETGGREERKPPPNTTVVEPCLWPSVCE